jgi:hypothetical protein
VRPSRAGRALGQGPLALTPPRRGPSTCLLLGFETSGATMGGGQAGAPVDDDHVPWSPPPPPRHGHRDLAGHGAGRPGWAGPDLGTGAGRGPDLPERPTGRGRGEAAGG